MKIALGTTKLAQGLLSGHLDGLAVYTAQLIEQFDAGLVTPFVFQRLLSKRLTGPFESFPASFERSILRGVSTSLPFQGNNDIKMRFDLFHATDHHIPKLKDIPVIATLMDPIPLKHPEWARKGVRPFKNWLFKRSTQWADHFITISQFVVEDIVKYFRIPKLKISVIPLGVDDVYFQPVCPTDKKQILDKFKLNPGFFLFIGTLQPRKNIMRIIEAFCSLPVKIQREHQLVIAGQRGWSCEEEIRKLKYLSSNGLAKWLNYVTPLEKRALLQSASALIFPSLYEGFGLPILEAFASELPVITSFTTALPETAGNAAALIDPLSINEISSVMLKIVSDDNYADILRSKGKMRAKQFTWRNTADKTWQLYKNVVK